MKKRRRANSKPAVILVGRGGNALAILGACEDAARDAGWDEVKINDFVAEATNGDYNHLLATATKCFDVR